MNRATMNRWLNRIIAITLVMLMMAALSAFNRVDDQKTYDRLAEQRALSLPVSESDAASSDSTRPDDQPGSEETKPSAEPLKPELNFIAKESAAPTSPYPYSENLNRQWIDLNPDYMGWLTIPGSRIDYPVVRGLDNEFYLDHDFYGERSSAGAIFMDYRNLGNFHDQHTLIYGHHLKKSDAMFHDLVLYHDPDYLAEHQLIQVSGLYEERTYRIFSVYEVSADDYSFTLEFDQDMDYRDYLNDLLDSSMHPAHFIPKTGQRLLTLVTCSYGLSNGRTIVHAVEVI